MRFTWFNLMPWPYLPDDFRQQNRSVWVDIPGKLYDPRKGHFVYHEYMDQLEYADALGFDGIGVNEHHQNGYGLMPSPNIIAAGLARRTSRAAICVIGNSIALYNPPIRVAEEFAMLDVISGGRLIAGFPVGTPMDTNFCYGQIPALTRDKYYEAHELIMRAWKEDEPFAFDGKYSQLRADALSKFPTLTWKQLVDDRYVIAGSPETVRQQMEEMIKGLRIGHVFCLFHNGNMPDWKTRHSSKLFAEQVMPKLRDLWPEWRADDRWWPKPMADRLEPERSLPRAEARS